MASPSLQPPHRARNTLLSSDEDALAYSDGTSASPQLNNSRGWRTASTGDKIWTEFEVRRSSAEYYLNLYYECMDAITADASSLDYGTIDQPLSPELSNANMVQLKIYRDTILRELIVMEDIAVYLQQAYNTSIHDSSIPTRTAIWTIACCLAAASRSSAVIVGASAAGAIAGGLALAIPPAWRAYHAAKLDGALAGLRDLKKTVADGEVPAQHKNLLDASRFASLEGIAESIQVVGGRVIGEES
ncbi:hypothetical protein B0T14DRAFT_514313 [Immersiella caudata]|uniref:Uncharacterized protein n=1 Tax=Immersiella caudata TaxID=314043 RepID=A0AA39WW31_9PEZI|nr:hypothetical protein B0T14DRAFT_514313 [Immersiella caudata]